MQSVEPAAPDVAAFRKEVLSGEDSTYAVYTLYCHGGVLKEQCPSAGVATRTYARRLIAGIKTTDQQSVPDQPSYHVALVAMVFRKDDEVKVIYSDQFTCNHEEDHEEDT